MTASTTKIHDIIDNYLKLCDYCDAIWNRVYKAYPNEIACRKGCGICCELQSVNRIEAYVIRSYIINNNIDDIGVANNNACPFLRDQTCAIYPARPIICRTHGLILRSSEFPLSRHAASCPYNFPSFHPNDIPPEMTVDVDIITKNLVNLNLAFCMAGGIDAVDKTEGTEIRVLLRDLAR